MNSKWLLWQTDYVGKWSNKFKLMKCNNSFKELIKDIDDKQADLFSFGKYLSNTTDIEGSIWNKNIEGFYICNSELLKKESVNKGLEDITKYKPDFFNLKGLRYKKFFKKTDYVEFDNIYKNIIENMNDESISNCYCIYLYTKKSFDKDKDKDKYKQEWIRQEINKNKIFIQQLWKNAEKETKDQKEQVKIEDTSKLKENEAIIIEIWTTDNDEDPNIIKLFNLKEE